MRTPRVLLVSIAPPQNDCGVRIVLHRHLVERGADLVRHRHRRAQDVVLRLPARRRSGQPQRTYCAQRARLWRVGDDPRLGNAIEVAAPRYWRRSLFSDCDDR